MKENKNILLLKEPLTTNNKYLVNTSFLFKVKLVSDVYSFKTFFIQEILNGILFYHLIFEHVPHCLKRIIRTITFTHVIIRI